MARRLGIWGTLAALALVGAGCFGGEPTSDEPLTIGLLLDFSGSPDASADRQRGFDLAIAQVNELGGVLGHPVRSVALDASGDVSAALEAARRLVEEEGVHAIVGPNSSAASLPTVETVTGPAQIPTISPSATAPVLAQAVDDDFFFRTTLADSAQGPVLARVAKERGFTNVGVSYRNDPYGRGLAETFAAAWDGGIVSVSMHTELTSYRRELEQTAGQGAEALVVIDFASAAIAIVKEAIESGLYDQFVFADAVRRPRVVEEVGGEHLGGMYGTSGAPPPSNEAGHAWDRAFEERYGQAPQVPYVKETYDAALAIMLAAQAAGSVEGAAIRDQLRVVADAPGALVHATPDGVAEALRLVREGKDINLEGAGGTLEWDDNGDLRRGHISIWRFTADGRIEDVEVVEVGY
ncbi:MAG: ABC transporter substrate-binding protein [Chloroflexota bacterium]|nr:ABC transporter substrate-binding protein [Chloroflexota bacterium]